MSAFVRAVVRAALADADGPAPARLEAEASQFVLRQLARLPDFMRLPIRGVGRALDALAIVTYRKPFVALDLRQQRYVMASARGSKIATVRDAVRLYESLAIFVREGTADA